MTTQPHDCDEETQEFRLQNDREWRAKLDHLKAKIAQLEAERASQETELAGLRAFKAEVERRVLEHIPSGGKA